MNINYSSKSDMDITINSLLQSNDFKKLLKSYISSYIQDSLSSIHSQLNQKASKSELANAIQSIKDLILFLRDEMNKRFEEMLHYIDKRFEAEHNYNEKRFEEINRRFNDMKKMYDKLFWLIVSFLTPLTISLFGILWKLIHSG